MYLDKHDWTNNCNLGQNPSVHSVETVYPEVHFTFKSDSTAHLPIVFLAQNVAQGLIA